MSDLKAFWDAQLQDPEFREYYFDMKASSDLGKAIVAGRLQNDLTQKDLSVLSGVPQANISRLESGEGNPSLKTLNRIAKAMGLMVKIELVPRSLEVTSEE